MLRASRRRLISFLTVAARKPARADRQGAGGEARHIHESEGLHSGEVPVHDFIEAGGETQAKRAGSSGGAGSSMWRTMDLVNFRFISEVGENRVACCVLREPVAESRTVVLHNTHHAPRQQAHFPFRHPPGGLQSVRDGICADGFWS